MARFGARQRISYARTNAQAGPSNAASSSNTEGESLGQNEERETLLQQKQAELGQVLDRHDDNLRELFHLERFVSLLHYDPKEAKKDHSAVFEEWKMKYDLVLNTPGAGPSRTTRRAQQERISVLKSQPQRDDIVSPVRSTNGIASQSSVSISATLPASGQGQNRAGKQTKSRLSAIAKGKQKESMLDEDLPTGLEISESISGSWRQSKGKGKGKLKESLSFPQARSSRSQSIVSDGASRLEDITESKTKSRRGKFKFKVPEIPHKISNGDLDQAREVSGTRQKRRDSGSALEKDSSANLGFHITLPASPSKKIAATETRPTVSGKTLPGSKHPADGEPPAPRTTIKRIRLIVREPPPTISSPRQRPPPPQFGKNLTALLSSYRHVDGVDYDERGFERSAAQKARLLDRIDTLRQEGRLLLDPDTALALSGRDEHGFRALSSVPINSTNPRPKDLWSIIVSEAISERNDLSRHRFGRGGAVASNIETKLRAYYNLQKSQGQREAAAEEKRVRALAKSTSRLVLAEWKKAVYHIREEERMRNEEEEKRLGKQHLDAILDKSGQILEKQHLDLHRTDVLRDIRRSVSASADGDDVEDDEDEDEDEDGEEHEETEVEDNEDDGPEPSPEEVLELNIEQAEDIEGGIAMDEESVVSSDSEDAVDLRAILVDDPVTGVSETQEEDIGAGTGDPSEADSQAGTSLADDMDLEQETDYVRVEEDGTSDQISNSAMPLESSPDETMQGDDKFPTAATLPVDDLYRLGLQIAQKAIPLKHITKVGPSGVSEDLKHEIILRDGSFTDPFDPNTTGSVDFIRDHSFDNKFLISGPEAHPIQNGHIRESSVAFMDESRSEVAAQTNGFKPHTPEIEPLNASVQPNGLKAVEPSEAPIEVAQTLTKLITGENEGGHNDSKAEMAQNGEIESAKPHEPGPVWEPPVELKPYAVARVDWHPEDKIKPPLLLRGNLRPYQQSGLEWLAALHNNNMNGILADEMGLGKTIQTIALLAHLACDRGIWGPHLIIVPTSVLLNWEMEFKKFLPGFKILSYHGSTKRRKELRKGWNDKFAFNVCVTSYTLASKDEHILKRKAWYYMILDEAHMIKNFKSQRWNILLMFKSSRRLLLTGTPLQNNLTELWALLQFLMSGTKFANLKEFGEWFSNPLEKAIEQGNVLSQEVQLRVTKLHTVLRPYLLRRLKRDVEKELPSKYEHLVLCRLSKRQRFLYDEFMSRNQTREDLKSGVYQRIANILMQLRKVCNHPDLFEVRPIVTSFAMERSAIADFEIKELLIRRMLMESEDQTFQLNLDLLGLRFTHLQGTSLLASQSISSLTESLYAELQNAFPGEPPPYDLRTIEGFRRYRAYQRRLTDYLRLSHMAYLNVLRCKQRPVIGRETIDIVNRMYNPLTIGCEAEFRANLRPSISLVKSYATRAEECADIVDKFAFATPAVVALDLPSIALRGMPDDRLHGLDFDFDEVLHRSAVKLQIAFPDRSLLQYDCGKLQELARLLQERKAGGHRVLIFTQMTRILDILEIFLNFHGYLYSRLDGATKIEDRQYITERFNVDERIFAFIASSRSGGVGINLTGADTVIFYDSDFNPQMDRQCEDRAHRIGQIRDVHIFRFVSQYTVEEAMLRKANQKRSLDDLVIQQGGFDWQNFFNDDEEAPAAVEIQKALVEFEDFEDAFAAKVAANEEAVLAGEDQADFADPDAPSEHPQSISSIIGQPSALTSSGDIHGEEVGVEEDDEGGTTVDYMLSFVRSDLEYFRDWKL